jgi:hypothetical protein
MTSLHWRVCRAEGNYSDVDTVFKIEEAKKSEIFVQFIHCVFTFMASLWSLACPTVHSGLQKNGGVQKYVLCFLQPIQRSDFLCYLVLEFGSYVTSEPYAIYMQTNHAGRVSFKLDEKQ